MQPSGPQVDTARGCPQERQGRVERCRSAAPAAREYVFCVKAATMNRSAPLHLSSLSFVRWLYLASLALFVGIQFLPHTRLEVWSESVVKCCKV